MTGVGEDQEVCVLNFRMEDCGRAVLGGDIFDVEMRPDIVHRVVRWQLAKRRQVRQKCTERGKGGKGGGKK